MADTKGIGPTAGNVIRVDRGGVARVTTTQLDEALLKAFRDLLLAAPAPAADTERARVRQALAATNAQTREAARAVLEGAARSGKIDGAPVQAAPEVLTGFAIVVGSSRKQLEELLGARDTQVARDVRQGLAPDVAQVEAAQQQATREELDRLRRQGLGGEPAGHSLGAEVGRRVTERLRAKGNAVAPGTTAFIDGLIDDPSMKGAWARGINALREDPALAAQARAVLGNAFAGDIAAADIDKLLRGTLSSFTEASGVTATNPAALSSLMSSLARRFPQLSGIAERAAAHAAAAGSAAKAGAAVTEVAAAAASTSKALTVAGVGARAAQAGATAAKAGATAAKVGAKAIPTAVNFAVLGALAHSLATAWHQLWQRPPDPLKMLNEVVHCATQAAGIVVPGAALIGDGVHAGLKSVLKGRDEKRAAAGLPVTPDGDHTVVLQFVGDGIGKLNQAADFINADPKTPDDVRDAIKRAQARFTEAADGLRSAGALATDEELAEIERRQAAAAKSVFETLELGARDAKLPDAFAQALPAIRDALMHLFGNAPRGNRRPLPVADGNEAVEEVERRSAHRTAAVIDNLLALVRAVAGTLWAGEQKGGAPKPPPPASTKA